MTGTFGERAYRFYRSLVAPSVPRGVQVMNPYDDPSVRRYVRAFLNRYFNDTKGRTLVLGINPGRFGAGITGVTFTDPVALADFCGVPNTLQRKRELSSVFIYDFIHAFGGVRAFYRRFFLTAVSPLGFTQGGTNLNYYDTPALQRRVRPFIIDSVRRQIALGARTDAAIVLGLGDNYRFLSELNDQYGFFRALHPLKHPRPIMQYERKKLARHIADYIELFTRVSG